MSSEQVDRLPENVQRLIKALDTLQSDSEYQFHKQYASGGYTLENGTISPLNAMQHFRVAIQHGVVPDAEVLFFVARSFGVYFASRHHAPLDDAFGIPPKRRTGTAVQKYSNRQLREQFMADMLDWLCQHPDATQSDACEAVSQQWQLLDRLWLPDQQSTIRYFQNFLAELREHHCDPLMIEPGHDLPDTMPVLEVDNK